MFGRAALLAVIACGTSALAGDPLNFKYDGVAAKDAVKAIAQVTDKSIHLDGEYAASKLTLQVKNATLRACLDQIARAVGGVVFVDGAAYRIVPQWKAKLLKTLTSERMTFQFAGESTRKILAVIATYAGLSMAIDPEFGDPPATVAFTNVTPKVALAETLKQSEAGFDLRYGVVYVASKKRLAALPARMKLKVPAKPARRRVHLQLLRPNGGARGGVGGPSVQASAGRAQGARSSARQAQPDHDAAQGPGWRTRWRRSWRPRARRPSSRTAGSCSRSVSAWRQ